MRGLARPFPLLLATVLWTGTATATAINAINVTPGDVPSETIYAPSDVVSVEVTMDSEIIIASYFFHVAFEQPALSLVSAAPYGPYPYPAGSLNPWSTLAGNLSLDAYGLYLNAYASGAKSRPGTFTDVWITTLVFHLVEPGDGELTIEPYFSPSGDVIGDANARDIKDVFENTATTIHTPEPTTSLLFGLGLLGLACAGRRQ